MTNSPDFVAVADTSKALITGALRNLVEVNPPENRPAIVTGALYAVVGVMCALRPRDMEPEAFRSSLVNSMNSALTQYMPGSPVPMNRSEVTESEFDNLMADMACRGVQEMGHSMVERMVGADFDPTDGVVSGTIATTAFLTAGLRDKAKYPQPQDVEPVIIDLLRATWGAVATHEAADAMGEAQGHG